MEFWVFDGEDAYWWILCIEEHFEKRETPEEKKLTEAFKLLTSCACQWSHWWNQHHQWVSWRFKPEYRDILPISNEEKPEFELERLTTQGSFNVQPQDINQGNHLNHSDSRRERLGRNRNGENRDRGRKLSHNFPVLDHFYQNFNCIRR